MQINQNINLKNVNWQGVFLGTVVFSVVMTIVGIITKARTLIMVSDALMLASVGVALIVGVISLCKAQPDGSPKNDINQE
jgi:uncharacterized membrane protein